MEPNGSYALDDATATNLLASSCTANPAWITNPSMPSDVAASQTNCDFHQFIYQAFFYLVQPTSTDMNVHNFQQFMPSYGLFVGPGEQPAPYGTVPKPGYCNAPALSAEHVYSNLTLQAGSHKALLDQQSQDVFYSIGINKPAYDMIADCQLYLKQCGLTLAPDLLGDGSVVNIPAKYPTLAFPNGAIELKASWKVLTQAEIEGGSFFTTAGTVSAQTGACNDVTLGMVGLHLVVKTPNHPEFLWATFEHRNNAPDCTDQGATPPLGGQWTFYNQNCTGDCDTNHPYPTSPTQVCRMHPWGDPSQGVFPNGLDCDSSPPPDYYSCKADVINNVIKPNTLNMTDLDASVQDMLSQLPVNDPNRLWANYELVGNLWTMQGSLPPNLQVQRGSLSDANTSMETFVQNGEVDQTLPNSCFSCHNLDGKTPADNSQPIQIPQAGLSHIFNLINMDTEGCADGNLPATCSAYMPPNNN